MSSPSYYIFFGVSNYFWFFLRFSTKFSLMCAFVATAGFKTNSPSLPTISLPNTLDGLLGEVNSPIQLRPPKSMSHEAVSLTRYCSHADSLYHNTTNDDWTTMMNDSNPYDLRAKYTHFRILVIGRANAGKTTLLQRVCNTTEDPCIYDNDKNLVGVQRPKDDEFCFWLFQLAWTYFGCTPFIITVY